MASTKPITVHPRGTLTKRILENFPEEMVLRPQWVLWKMERRGERMTKVPYQPNGMLAESSTPSTWFAFTDVMTAYIFDDTFSGLGFVFSADDPFIGIDLDKCRDLDTGEVAPWAADLLGHFDTYTELSPSGKGFHCIGKGQLPPSGRRKGQVEMYESGRYFTVTGDHYGHSPREARDVQPQLIEVHEKIFGGPVAKATVKQHAANEPAIASPEGPPETGDTSVIDRILGSNDAETYKRLHAGDWAALGYPSQSEGDLAMVGILARHAGPHAGQIDRLFRTTGMMRDKWDEYRGSNTYGEMTITKVLESQATIYAQADFLAQMNKRFAVIKNGNQVRILEEIAGGTDFRLFSRSDFELLTTNLPFPDKAKSAAAAWLRNPHRREFDRIVFSPGQEKPGCYNLWRGFSVQATPGGCTLFWQFARDAICAGSPNLYLYVRKYFAHMIQRPWERPEVAIVMRGGQGTGKNTFVDTMGSLVRTHFCEVSCVDQLTGRFNAHMRNAILIHANEATWGGNRSESGKLKAMITDATIPIEMKGVDILHIDNYMRLVVSSNNAWPVPVEADDRRFILLDVAPKYKQDTVFFAALHAELDNGGREALMHDLLTEDLTGFSPRNRPASPFGADMKLRSADTVTRWLFECLDANGFSYSHMPNFKQSLFDQIGGSAVLHKEEFFNSYQHWCKTSPDRYPIARDQFFKRLYELLGPSMTETRPSAPSGQPRERALVLSGLGACRIEFEVAAGVAGAVAWEAP